MTLVVLLIVLFAQFCVEEAFLGTSRLLLPVWNDVLDVSHGITPIVLHSFGSKATGFNTDKSAAGTPKFRSKSKITTTGEDKRRQVERVLRACHDHMWTYVSCRRSH